MRKFLTIFATIFAVCFAIWMSAVLFVGLAVIGVIGYGLYFARGFLVDKGILNPTPGIPPQDVPEQAPVIEGDFTRLDDQQPR